MRTLRLFLVCVLAALPSASLAQSRTALSVGLGPSLPVAGLRQTNGTGTDFTVGLVRGSDDSPLGVRLDVGYDKLNGKTVKGVVQPDRKTTSGSLNVLFSFSGYTMKPYVVGGVGLYKMISKPAAAEAKTRFGFDMGLGFTFPVGGKAVFLESRINSISQNNAKPLRYAPIILGFLF